jgi:hypothetical protein
MSDESRLGLLARRNRGRLISAEVAARIAGKLRCSAGSLSFVALETSDRIREKLAALRLPERAHLYREAAIVSSCDEGRALSSLREGVRVLEGVGELRLLHEEVEFTGAVAVDASLVLANAWNFAELDGEDLSATTPGVDAGLVFQKYRSGHEDWGVAFRVEWWRYPSVNGPER